MNCVETITVPGTAVRLAPLNVTLEIRTMYVPGDNPETFTAAFQEFRPPLPCITDAVAVAGTVPGEST